MDKTQLVTIAVTAVVSVIAKELITWLVSQIKTLSVMKTARAKVKAAFNTHNRKIIKDLLWLASYVAILVYFLRSEAPVTRFEIFIIVLLVLLILASIVVLLYHIGAARLAFERQRKADLEAGDPSNSGPA